jgi:hypothetical protein
MRGAERKDSESKLSKIKNLFNLIMNIILIFLLSLESALYFLLYTVPKISLRLSPTDSDVHCYVIITVFLLP